jgi:hypothetical protein
MKPEEAWQILMTVIARAPISLTEKPGIEQAISTLAGLVAPKPVKEPKPRKAPTHGLSDALSSSSRTK